LDQRSQFRISMTVQEPGGTRDVSGWHVASQKKILMDILVTSLTMSKMSCYMNTYYKKILVWEYYMIYKYVYSLAFSGIEDTMVL
jgi:hypothetical protein